MQIAELKNGKSIERRRDFTGAYGVGPELQTCRVPTTTSIKARDYQTEAYDGMRPGKVFEVKIIYALAKDLSLMVSLDAQTKVRVQSS
jgi:hypothetical protein